MMTKIEEVARAMHERADSRNDPRFRVAWEKCRPDYRDMMLDDALAALRALREPSEGMIGAVANVITGAVGATCCHKSGGRGGEHAHENCDCRSVAPAAFQAAIDHVIHEAETA